MAMVAAPVVVMAVVRAVAMVAALLAFQVVAEAVMVAVAGIAEAVSAAVARLLCTIPYRRRYTSLNKVEPGILLSRALSARL